MLLSGRRLSGDHLKVGFRYGLSFVILTSLKVASYEKDNSWERKNMRKIDITRFGIDA